MKFVYICEYVGIRVLILSRLSRGCFCSYKFLHGSLTHSAYYIGIGTVFSTAISEALRQFYVIGRLMVL